MRGGLAWLACLIVLYAGAGEACGADRAPDREGTNGRKESAQQKRPKKGTRKVPNPKEPRQQGMKAAERQGREEPGESLPAAPLSPPPQVPAAPAPEAVLEPLTPPDEVYFSVLEFQIEGNTLLPQATIDERLNPFKGFAQKIADIEKARAALERAYHEKGYPTVLVTVPEQTVETGTVRLRVTESKIGEVTVSGIRYFSTERILEKVPSLRPGALLYEPTMTKELDAVNANPDRQISPVLKPGKEPGTVDLDLKVTDRYPLHAKITGDNRGPITTPRNRLTAEIQHANVWGREHILTLQTVQTPTDWGAVQTYGGTYVAPLPREQLFTLYAAKTISNSVLAGAALPAASAGDIGIAGNATVAGFRYAAPFSPLGAYHHQVTVGMDYKRLEKTTATFPGDLGTAVVLSPIQYTPITAAYSAYRPDSLGISSLSASVKGYVAGMIPGGSKGDFGGDQNDPLNKPGNRKGSTGTFVVLQGTLDRVQQLPEEFSLTAHLDGQWANEPLIPAEQYFAGGLDTVRGYFQYETIGDNAARARVEGLSPSVSIPFDREVNPRLKLDLRLAAFYDAAFLWIRRAQPGQTDRFQLEGVGGGIRANLAPFNLKLHLDQGFALRDAVVTKKGDTFLHFSVEVAF